MRYIIYGAGAIGGVTGARLFQHGHEVMLIARGTHLEALQQQGLTFKAPGEEHHFNIPAVGHPSQIQFRPDDVVFLTMKTQDTEAALTDLEAAAGNDIPVFCLQNGVENERIAARRFSRVYGVHVGMSSTFLTPGVIAAENGPISGILDPGCYPRGVDDIAHAVAADLDGSMISSQAQPDVMRWKYTKLLGSLNNAVSVICGLAADTGDLRRALREEGLRAYAAAGIRYTSDEENQERRTVTRRGGGSGNSTYQSILRGLAAIEADFFNGEIVLLGRLHGVPTPANEAVRRLSNQVARERKQPGSFTPADIMRLADSLSQEVAVK